MPEFYLRGFRRQGYMWVCDREKDTYRRQRPLNTPVITHHYTSVDEQGRRNTDVESFLSRLETEPKPIIEKVDAGKLLSDQEEGIPATFPSYPKTAVPGTEDTTIAASNEVTKNVLEHFVSSEGSVKAMLERYEQATEEKTDLDPKELLHHLQSGNLKVKVETLREFYFRFMIEAANEMAPVVLDRAAQVQPSRRGQGTAGGIRFASGDALPEVSGPDDSTPVYRRAESDLSPPAPRVAS